MFYNKVMAYVETKCYDTFMIYNINSLQINKKYTKFVVYKQHV